MKIAGWVTSVVVAFLAGWGIGRGGSGTPPVEDSVTTTAKPAKTVVARSEVPAWGRRLREASQEKQIEEWDKVPREDRPAAMRAWFESFGFGGPSVKDLEKVRTVIDRWVAEDFDAAWQWAEGLVDPIAREFAVVGVAGALSGTDPNKSLDCLAVLGEVQRPIDDWRIGQMIHGESNRSVADGAEALKRVWAKVPMAGDTVNRMSGNYLDLSKAVDLASFADALREIREAGSRPVTLGGAMIEWAKRDVAAATGYLVDRGLTERVADEWRELHWEVRKGAGEKAADAWTLETLRQVPVADRGAFLDHISSSPESILGLDPGLYDEGERNELATTFLVAALEGENSLEKIMGFIPEEERGAVIGQLRGVTKPGQLAIYLRNRGTSEDEISRIVGVVGQPRE